MEISKSKLCHPLENMGTLIYLARQAQIAVWSSPGKSGNYDCPTIKDSRALASLHVFPNKWNLLNERNY